MIPRAKPLASLQLEAASVGERISRELRSLHEPWCVLLATTIYTIYTRMKSSVLLNVDMIKHHALAAVPSRSV